MRARSSLVDDIGFNGPRRVLRRVRHRLHCASANERVSPLYGSDVVVLQIFDALKDLYVGHENGGSTLAHRAEARGLGARLSAHWASARQPSRRYRERRLVGLGRLELPTSPLAGSAL